VLAQVGAGLGGKPVGGGHRFTVSRGLDAPSGTSLDGHAVGRATYRRWPDRAIPSERHIRDHARAGARRSPASRGGMGEQAQRTGLMVLIAVLAVVGAVRWQRALSDHERRPVAEVDLVDSQREGAGGPGVDAVVEI